MVVHRTAGRIRGFCDLQLPRWELGFYGYQRLAYREQYYRDLPILPLPEKSLGEDQLKPVAILDDDFRNVVNAFDRTVDDLNIFFR